MAIVDLTEEEEWEAKKKMAEGRGRNKRRKPKPMALRQKHRREEAFNLMLKGFTRREISDQLGISTETVRKDINAVYKYCKENPLEIDIMRMGAYTGLQETKEAMRTNYSYTVPGSRESIDQLKALEALDSKILSVSMPKGVIVAHTSTPKDAVRGTGEVYVPSNPDIPVNYYEEGAPEEYLDAEYEEIDEEEPEPDPETDPEADREADE